MIGRNHRKVNIAGALTYLTYSNLDTNDALCAVGIVACSSFPDRIEKVGLGHRGISHNLFVYGLLYYLSTVFPIKPVWLISFLTGCLLGSCLHVIADIFSVRGVGGVKFKCYTTGSTSETVFLWSMIITMVATVTWERIVTLGLI